MAQRKPWQPKMDDQQELNPFVNGKSEDRVDNHEIREPDVDSAPLQGSHDLSDEDSLEDVIADSDEPTSDPRDPGTLRR